MNFLLTNDDGIHSDGIIALETLFSKKNNIFVCAPAENKSCSSHAMLLNMELDYKKFSDTKYSVEGFPVNSVVAGLYGFFRNIQFDYVLSGINMGANLGTDVFYSGTYSAALRSSEAGIDSVALSINRSSLSLENSVMGYIEEMISTLIDKKSIIKKRSFDFIKEKFPEMASHHKIPASFCLNINIPDPEKSVIKGIKPASLAKRVYNDTIYYPEANKIVMSGHESVVAYEKQTDAYWVHKGYISVSPFFYYFPGMLILIPETCDDIFEHITL